MRCLVTDWEAMTNTRVAQQIAAGEILAAWGINEPVSSMEWAELIAGCHNTIQTITVLAQRYGDQLPDSIEIPTWAKRYEAALTSKLEADRQAQRYLHILQQEGGFGSALLLMPGQDQLRPALMSGLFPKSSRIVVDPSSNITTGTTGASSTPRAAIEFVLDQLFMLTLDGCLGVFGNADNVAAGAAVGITVLGHVNGQGAAADKFLRLAGARHTVSDWHDVVSHMAKMRYDLPHKAVQRLPQGPLPVVEYLSRHQGPPTSFFNPPRFYFSNKMPPRWVAPWLYWPYLDPRKLTWEELEQLRDQARREFQHLHANSFPKGCAHE